MMEWKCANQKVPRLTVAELRSPIGSEANEETSRILDEQTYLGAWSERPYAHRKDIFFGHGLVADESIVFDHGFIVDDHDNDVLGWRITAEMWLKRWNWWSQPVETDAWTFASTTIVNNPKFGASSASIPQLDIARDQVRPGQ